MKIPELRIALFTGSYNHIADGVSLTLNRLVAYLENRGAKVRVFGPTTPVPALKHAGTLVPVPSVTAPGRSDYRLSLGLSKEARRLLTEFNPNLFHIATPDLLGLAALRTALKQRITVVSSYHTHFASYLDYYRLGLLEGITWRYLRWFYGRCRHVYVPTPSMVGVMRANGINGDLRLWPRGVESGLFNPVRRSLEWRRDRGLGASDVVVTFVSRLVTEKGLGVVADVIKGLESRGVSHRAVIIGDGPERASLGTAIPRAIFEGHLTGDSLATAYASSDVFLFPSETETFGNVTLEAMASGLPAVVANATGSNALVKEGVTGFLARPRDSDEFTDRVERLVTDAELRAKMGAAARTAAEGYEWSNVLGRLASYYEEID